MPMTAKQILEIAKQKRPRFYDSSKFVVIHKVVEGHLRKTGAPIVKCTTSSTALVTDKGTKGKPPPPIKKYQTAVYGLKPNTRLYKDYVKCSCNCDAFVFWGGEWALKQKGAADILYGNGQPPVVRNPKNIPWGCKHVIKVLREILKNQV